MKYIWWFFSFPFILPSPSPMLMKALWQYESKRPAPFLLQEDLLSTQGIYTISPKIQRSKLCLILYVLHLMNHRLRKNNNYNKGWKIAEFTTNKHTNEDSIAIYDSILSDRLQQIENACSYKFITFFLLDWNGFTNTERLTSGQFADRANR